MKIAVSKTKPIKIFLNLKNSDQKKNKITVHYLC